MQEEKFQTKGTLKIDSMIFIILLKFMMILIFKKIIAVILIFRCSD